MPPLPSPGHPICRAAKISVVVLAAACGRSTSQPGSAASAAPAGSAAPAPAASSASAPSNPNEPPRGAGVAELKPAAEIAACRAKSGEVATYLQRPGLRLAGRADGTFAALWLVELQNNPDAQIAFAGFDGEARQAARARSIGATRSEGLRILDSAGAWAAIWFDADGLAYTRPRWETTPPPEIQHLSAIGKEASENVAIAAEPGGALVAAAPFGEKRDQLGVFLFAPADPAQPAVKALGVTHHAAQPRGPAVVADADGYVVAWHEEDGRIRASRFDKAGKERDAHDLAAAGPKRERLVLAATAGGGALAVWIEDGSVVARALDPDAAPRSAPWIIGKGAWRAVAPSGDGALVAWVGNDGKSDGQLLLARVGADGAPSATGLRLSDGTNAVKDPPGLAVAGARVGVLWTEAMGPAVSTKRAFLRVIDAACVP